MADVSNGNGLREHMLLFSRFLRNPRRVGALAPSGPELAREMVSGLPTDESVTVVELGPGTGALTGAIVDRLHESARFLTVDIDPTFVAKIRERWPSVESVCASAEQLEALLAARKIGQIDHVISGLPFASLPIAVTRRILDNIERTLRPAGSFTTFQYVHGYGMPPGRLFRKQMSERIGGPVDRRLVMRNFPPAYVLTWTRRTSSSTARSAPSESR